MSAGDGRRSVTVSLPASDPASARILSWLDSQPPDADISRALRQVIVIGIDVAAAIGRIEARLDGLTLASVVPDEPPPDPETMDALFDFGSLV